MPEADLIVCERTGRWATVLSKFDPDMRKLLRQTRSLPETRKCLRESNWSVLALECTAENLGKIIAWLPSICDEFPDVRTIVMTERGLQAADCILRSAGAHHVVHATQGMNAASQWIRRHLNLAPPRIQTIEAWTHERLPWRK